MILHDLLYDGKSDTASSLGRISGNIGTVKTVKNIRQILGGNPLAVILDLHLDKITHILHPKLDDPPWLLHILNGITHDIMDHTADLLTIRNNLHTLLHIIGIHKLDPPGLHLKPKLLRTIRKIILHIQLAERIRNTVGIDLGIKGQLIDQMIHLIGLIINGTHIPVHLLRRIRHTIHDPLHITLHRSDRRLQVMGNIADQLLILLIHQDLLFRGLLQTLTHLLKILAKLGKFIIPLNLQHKIQIPLLDVLGSLLKLHQWNRNTPIDPQPYGQRGKNKDDRCGQDHILGHQLHLAAGRLRQRNIIDHLAGIRSLAAALLHMLRLRLAEPVQTCGKKKQRQQDDRNEAHNNTCF